MNKIRLDVYLYENGYADSREKAKALIMAGNVYVDNQKAYKAGETVTGNPEILIKENLPFVSRGGLKLQKALKSFNIDLNGMVCVDIGASTGGFTDCMLKNGAKKVFSVDVGYGQLDWRLRSDERVKTLERTNARYLSENEIPKNEVDFLTADVSFISLNTALSTVVDLIKDTARLMVLIKPQFEAGREFVGKKGVVRDISVHKDVIIKVCNQMILKGLTILNLDFSPIKGPEGNIEYLLYMTKEKKLESADFEALADRITKLSHNEL